MVQFNLNTACLVHFPCRWKYCQQHLWIHAVLNIMICHSVSDWCWSSAIQCRPALAQQWSNNAWYQDSATNLFFLSVAVMQSTRHWWIIQHMMALSCVAGTTQVLVSSIRYWLDLPTLSSLLLVVSPWVSSSYYTNAGLEYQILAGPAYLVLFAVSGVPMGK